MPTPLAFSLVRRLAAGGAAALLMLAAAPAARAADVDVGVSVRIGQPGFYGVIDIGSFPRPVLVTPQPVIIVDGGHRRAPMYLNVPPGHRKDWRKHCKHYGACGHPVYFVRNDWYDGVYAPEYRRRHDGDDRREGWDRGGRHDHGGGRGRGHDHGHDHERGGGKGRGHDGDRGHDHDRGGKGRGGHDPDHDRGHGGGHGKGRD